MLAITRAENEKTYLDHQIRTLRRLHPGEMEAVWDCTPGPGFYDNYTVYIKSPLLWPAYEALYPRDRRNVTQAALEAAGFSGLVALWCDSGTRFARKAEIRIKGAAAESEAIESWAESLGHPCRVRRRGPVRTVMTWNAEHAQRLMKAIRPVVHPSKRPSLWPGKAGEQNLYACR